MTRGTHGLLCAAGLTLMAGGCAASQQEGGATVAAPTASPQQAAAYHARMFRNEAYALGEMAERRRLEADVLSRELGPDHPSVEKQRRLAEELRAEAEEADKQARALRRAVPHGMVQ